jgi:hypothetical protein
MVLKTNIKITVSTQETFYYKIPMKSNDEEQLGTFECNKHHFNTILYNLEK